MEFTNRLANSAQFGAAGLIARRNSLYSIGISAVSDRPRSRVVHQGKWRLRFADPFSYRVLPAVDRDSSACVPADPRAFGSGRAACGIAGRARWGGTQENRVGTASLDSAVQWRNNWA